MTLLLTVSIIEDAKIPIAKPIYLEDLKTVVTIVTVTLRIRAASA